MLMELNNTKDILKFRDEFLADETPLKVQMRRYEETGNDRLAPTLEPMRINWEIIKGRWNERVCELIIERVVGEERLTEEEFEAVSGAFIKRLKRLRDELSKHRPRDGETADDVVERAESRDQDLAAARRRNARRKQVSRL